MSEILHLASVASTSTEAAELLARGKKPPFAVLADTQTRGKGRRGTTWQSPKGNLFLTVVLPPPAEPVAQHGLLPLRAGTLVGRFLQERMHLRVTLKWPNDLLVEGKKLGGLLLEGSHAGNAAGAVLVGIGLNVEEAPVLKDAPYEAVALKTLLGKAPDATKLGKDLAAYLFAGWNGLALKDVAAAFATFAVVPGHVWKDGAALRRYAGVAPSGQLRLEPLDGGAALELTSADHGWHWVHQNAAPLVVGDAGNTSLKLALFASATAAEPVWRRQIAWTALAKEAPQALAELKAKLPAKSWPLFVGYVHPQGAAELTKLAEQQGLPVEVLPKRPVRYHGAGYELKELGIDRLAAIEGWARLGRGRAIVVSAGTATTIDVVGEGGEHLGGYIIPGLKTALKALHEATSLLPALDPAAEAMPPEASLGHDTRSAMLGGALRMTAAAIAETARESAAPVILSGGYAEALSRWLPDAEVHPDLVVSGLRVLAL